MVMSCRFKLVSIIEPSRPILQTKPDLLNLEPNKYLCNRLIPLIKVANFDINSNLFKIGSGAFTFRKSIVRSLLSADTATASDHSH